MQMKRIIALFLTLIIAVSFVSCANLQLENEVSSTPSTSTPKEETTSKEEDKNEIGKNEAENTDENEALVKEGIAIFKKNREFIFF